MASGEYSAQLARGLFRVHKITLKPGMGLFVECPVCGAKSRIVGSNVIQVIFAFSSANEQVRGKCATCDSEIAWSPRTARVASFAYLSE